MTERYTAAQARASAGPTVTETVDDALVLIRKAAEKRLRRLALHGEFWVQGGYSQTKEWKEAAKQLTDLGYTVDFFYQEGSIAVDMYTTVSW